MRRSIWIAMVVACAGCEKKESRFEGPVRIAFGDCAKSSVSWVSGPRPLPFTPEEAEAARTAKREVDDRDAPPKPDAGSQGGPASDRGSTFATLTADLSGLDDAGIYGGLTGSAIGVQGGFGYGRADGQGWGTIGVGRYGGGGGGYGVGLGRGGMRGRVSAAPSVRMGQPTVTGDLDKAIIRRYLRRNTPKIQYCYEKRLLARANLEGTLSAQFTITANGTVDQATASGLDPTVADCVATVLKGIEFPKPKGGSVVQVTYPFTFQPAGVPVATGYGAAPSAPNGGGSATPPADPPKPAAPKPAPPASATPYLPGERNPLRGETEALAECFRKNPKPYGAVVVQLEVGASGAVTAATAYGLDNDEAKECVVEVAKRTRGGAAGSQRCSLAFGEMPLDAAPTIEITSTEISMNGRPVATLPVGTASDSPTFRIPSLYDLVKQSVEVTRAPTAPVVAIRGPGVIRPLDSTPMHTVDRVMATVAAAGDDYVLAAQEARPAEQPRWALLRPIKTDVPVVPVPIGTGGSWNDRDTTRTSRIDRERVHLSVLVEKEHVWIGLSRVNEFIQVPRDGKEWEHLAAKLKEQKQSTFFTERADIEIAGERVTYGEVVKAVVAANDAGFTWWQVMDPGRISARPSL